MDKVSAAEQKRRNAAAGALWGAAAILEMYQIEQAMQWRLGELAQKIHDGEVTRP
ncbi:Uncharacterised protein [Mycobacteroides abscessus subsp. massiliense]|nr:Uncharacterised protein [Mycobacteroides abscessus subsp. abscessus]SKM67738.1 Uncharacterised protein [Mycobacteroides abscessus subsp. massiliense]SKN34065.1 Uncharacterised protein [Mycobacteroides abscessus subsp. massiliense]SKP16017.1 Uncharacterised protein [Mycobacteroides abscessus subsp. massiliense]SKP57447.1 Uncharacterised protein [Mycobacteroides abscessus subsp. massiliense]